MVVGVRSGNCRPLRPPLSVSIPASHGPTGNAVRAGYFPRGASAFRIYSSKSSAQTSLARAWVSSLARPAEISCTRATSSGVAPRQVPSTGLPALGDQGFDVAVCQQKRISIAHAQGRALNQLVKRGRKFGKISVHSHSDRCRSAQAFISL